MDFVMKEHAKRRARQRKVTEEQIREVLAAPSSWRYDPNQGSVRLEGPTSQGTLKVWVAAPWPPVGKVIVVRSVAWKGCDDGDIAVD